jgi:hypothetical protein
MRRDKEDRSSLARAREIIAAAISGEKTGRSGKQHPLEISLNF